MNVEITNEQLENINLSDEVREKALKKAREGYIMTLLEFGEITSGRAAKILGVSRSEVITLMNQWGISVFDDSPDLEELRQEVEQAEYMLNQQKPFIKIRNQ